MRKIFTVGFLASLLVTAQAQTVGVIRIERNPLVEELLRKHVDYNVRHPQIDGFRIRIFRDNGSGARDRSSTVKANFANQFPSIPSYLGYDNPYFKVSVGDFRSKDEAMRFFMQIKRTYPNAYIVAESINLPPL